MGQEAWGGTRETKTICTSGPAKTMGEKEGSAHQSAPGPAGSWCSVAFWSLVPGASCKSGINGPLTLEAPSGRQGEPKSRTRAPGYHSTSVPKRPLTRIQAATISMAVATRLFLALTSTPASLHQLSFQRKPKGSSQETPLHSSAPP